jgi:hypothetical protein
MRSFASRVGPVSKELQAHAFESALKPQEKSVSTSQADGLVMLMLGRWIECRSFVQSVVMGKDVVPRAFSCYYPEWASRLLDRAGQLDPTDATAHPSLALGQVRREPNSRSHLV